MRRRRAVSSRHNTSDRGTTIIFVALTVAVLFGFAAIAVDAAGIGMNARRQSQSAADVGALAAVQFAVPSDLGNAACVGSGLALSRCNGAMEAMAVANATLDDPSLALWEDASRCGTPPAGFTVSADAGTACVAFSANNQRAWVRIPTVDKPTTLARVIGIDTIPISAEAIAGANFFGAGNVLPFLLPGDAVATDYNCLKTGPNPNFGACVNLPGTGNFGSMDFFLYGNDLLQWTAKCFGDTNGRLTANIARGVDHPLGLYTDSTFSAPGTSESANCPDFNAEPDMAQGQPGVGSALEDGLLYGGSAYAASSYQGRIEDPGDFLVRNQQGSTPKAWIDNEPLWDFLVDDGNIVVDGGACDDEEVDTPPEMEACIHWAKTDAGGPHVIFTDALRDSIRYGWTPLVWEPDFLTPGTTYHIRLFLPVYLDTTFYACGSNSCVIMHTPGVPDLGVGVLCPANPSPDTRITCGTPGSGNRSLSAVTAYVLSQDIVPENAKTPAPGSENQRTYNLTN